MREQHNRAPFRGRRIAELLHREISDIILNRLGDKQIGYTTVLRVVMSRDMKYAKVYVSVMGDKKTRDLTLRALCKAAGFIQYELSSRVMLRYLPQLRFHLDTSLDYSEHINSVIRDLRAHGDMGHDGDDEGGDGQEDRSVPSDSGQDD